MAANDGFAEVDTPFGEVGLLAPLQADVAILHAPVADRAGNVAVAPPLLEGVWGALGARRGAIVTVERVVDDLRAVVGPRAHPRAPGARGVRGARWARIRAGCSPGTCPVDGYGEDYDFWVEARAATRRDDYDDWIRHWILEPDDQDEYLDAARRRAGRARCGRRPTRRVHADARGEHRPDLDAPPNAWEHAATFAARAPRRPGRRRSGAHAVLAGAGVANLAAWLGVQLAARAGRDVQLTAEIGLWGYEPMVGDPFVLNHGNFPTATMLGDAAMVLGGARRRRGHDHDRVPRRRAGRPRRQHQLDA